MLFPCGIRVCHTPTPNNVFIDQEAPLSSGVYKVFISIPLHKHDLLNHSHVTETQSPTSSPLLGWFCDQALPEVI